MAETTKQPKQKQPGQKPGQLKTVPESILKQRRLARTTRRIKTGINRKRQLNARPKRNLYMKRAEAYVREYRAKERDEVRLKRQAKKEGNFYVKEEAQLAFVMRIRGVNGISPKPRKVLKLLRLRQINNGIFVRLNKATLNMLRIAEPYITWGYPNVKTIRDLIYKRGFLKIQGKRTPITGNDQVERMLGKQDIICVEDLVHEIYSSGSNFKKATNMLWPFKLNNPNGGWVKKTQHFIEGGDFGNRENKINILLRKMI